MEKSIALVSLGLSCYTTTNLFCETSRNRREHGITVRQGFAMTVCWLTNNSYSKRRQRKKITTNRNNCFSCWSSLTKSDD